MSKAFLITFTRADNEFVAAGTCLVPGAWEACQIAEANMPPEATDFHVERMPRSALEKLQRWREGVEAMPVISNH